ncbi:MAG: hypothetical protein ACI9MB_004599, partial [Verrucomicrobiales bacterium]
KRQSRLRMACAFSDIPEALRFHSGAGHQGIGPIR